MRDLRAWPCGFKKKFDYIPEIRFDTKAAPRMAANPLPDADCSGDFAKNIALGFWIAGEADKNFEDACDSHDYAYDLLRYAEDVGVSNGQIYTVRLRADEVFNEMMGSVCGNTGYWGLNWTKDVCQLARGAFYTAVKFWTRLQHGPP